MPDFNPDADLTWGLQDIRARIVEYAVWDRYMDGDHDLALTSKRWRNTFGHIMSSLALNMCPSIVGALSDRLGIKGFDAPDRPATGLRGGDGDDGLRGPEPSPPGVNLADRATAKWGPRMVIAENQVTDDAITYGDGFVAVDVDPTTKRSVIWPQNPAQCAVRYSTAEPGVVDVAVKVWPEQAGGATRRYRANVYYRDFTFRYITAGKHQTCPDRANKFVAYDEDPAVYPVEENPTGMVPIFHFGHKARVNQYGVSLLKIVKPIQDALNKQVLDIVVGSEYVALPQRWATGVGGGDDQQAALTGQTGPRKPRFRPGVDRIWTTSNAAASFGEFPGADLSRLIPVADFYKVSAAQVTGTPAYYMLLLGGEPPTGESLKVMDARLVKRAQRCMDQWGSTWVQVMLCAMALEDGRRVDLNEASGLVVLWENPEVRNHREDAEVANLKQLAGVSKRRTLLEIGYTDDEVEEFMRERDEEAQAALAAAQAAMNAASAGGFPPVRPDQRRPAPALPNGAASNGTG